MNILKIFVTVLALEALVIGQTPVLFAQTDNDTGVTVFAAASLTDAFQTLANRFQAKHPSARVLFNFAGSQQLVQQIIHGAKADILASADVRQMAVAAASGIVDTGTVRTFAGNRLVLIVPADNPAHVEGLRDLGKRRIKLVLADSGVPAGLYAVRILDRCSKTQGFGSSFTKNVLENVVSYEENVRAVLSKVRLGECDAGIVYSSDVAHDSMHTVHRIGIPDSVSIIAEYPAALLRDCGSPKLAREFLDYLLSDEASGVLAEYGFIGVNEQTRR